MTGTDITKKNQFLIFYLEDDYIVEKPSFNPCWAMGQCGANVQAQHSRGSKVQR